MKIGLVLSGGGARGFAQIGVLKILKKHNIRIDYIAGSSIGSLIGACYAYNQDPDEIEKLLIKMKNKRDIYDFTFSTKGIIKGQKLESYITEFFGQKKITFKDLKIPLAINATNITNASEVVFREGLLIPAIMASISYPGFFTTRRIDKDLCVDGGVVNPLPINLLPDVEYIILVDVSEEMRKIDDNSNMKDIVLQSTLIMQRQIVNLNMRLCEKKYILIRPNVESTGIFDFDKPEQLIDIGEKEALLSINNLKKDIEILESLEKTPGKLEKQVSELTEAPVINKLEKHN